MPIFSKQYKMERCLHRHSRALQMVLRYSKQLAELLTAFKNRNANQSDFESFF